MTKVNRTFPDAVYQALEWTVGDIDAPEVAYTAEAGKPVVKLNVGKDSWMKTAQDLSIYYDESVIGQAMANVLTRLCQGKNYDGICTYRHNIWGSLNHPIDLSDDSSAFSVFGMLRDFPETHPVIMSIMDSLITAMQMSDQLKKKNLGQIHVWFEYVENKDANSAFWEESYEDGQPLDGFAASQGISWYDHDWFEGEGFDAKEKIFTAYYSFQPSTRKILIDKSLAAFEAGLTGYVSFMERDPKNYYFNTPRSYTGDGFRLDYIGSYKPDDRFLYG